MSKRIKIAAAFALAAVLAAVMGAVAFGSDTDSGSLTVVTNASAGTPLRLYKVADFGEDYVFTLTDDFAGQSLELDGLDDEKWQKLADTFSNFIASTKTEIPCAEAEADGEKAVFGGLGRGLYLLDSFYWVERGEQHRRLSVKPALICLPNFDSDGVWSDKLTVIPKEGNSVDVEDIKLVVVWENDTPEVRPETVEYTLKLLGEEYDKITLGLKANAARMVSLPVVEDYWRYEWSDLDKHPSDDWSMAQSAIPEGYTTTIEFVESDNAFLVVNTYKKPETPPDTPPEPSEPSEPDEPFVPAEPSEPDNEPGGHGKGYEIGRGTLPERKNDPTGEHYPYTEPSEPYVPGESVLPGGSQPPEEPAAVVDEPVSGAAAAPGEKLPQTGQLLWPLPILAAAGMILFVVGYLRSKGTSDDDE